MSEPSGLDVRFVGGPCDGRVSFFYGQLPTTTFCGGGAYTLEYNGTATYKFIPQVQRDALRAWNRLMRALAHSLPQSVGRSRTARRRARRLLR